jgi:hypothetical protein
VNTCKEGTVYEHTVRERFIPNTLEIRCGGDLERIMGYGSITVGSIRFSNPFNPEGSELSHLPTKVSEEYLNGLGVGVVCFTSNDQGKVPIFFVRDGVEKVYSPSEGKKFDPQTDLDRIYEIIKRRQTKKKPGEVEQYREPGTRKEDLIEVDTKYLQKLYHNLSHMNYERIRGLLESFPNPNELSSRRNYSSRVGYHMQTDKTPSFYTAVMINIMLVDLLREKRKTEDDTLDAIVLDDITSFLKSDEIFSSHDLIAEYKHLALNLLGRKETRI